MKSHAAVLFISTGRRGSETGAAEFLKNKFPYRREVRDQTAENNF
jgi:hypothetical protein